MNPNKVKKIAIIALIFAIIGWELPMNEGTIWVVNNTNLAPTVAGEPPGTGERIKNTTYWANNSPIQLMVYSHASSTGQDAEIHVFINDTKVLDTSSIVLGPAQQTNKSISVTIPQYANYSVQLTNSHHYEWREYPILTGEITTNLTGSSGSSSSSPGCTGNCSFDGVWANSLRKNDTTDSYATYINLSSPFGKFNTAGNIFSLFALPNGEYATMQSQNSTSGNYSQVYVDPEEILLQVTDGDTTSYRLGHTTIEQIISGTTYKYNGSYFDMGRANITNLNDVTMSGFLNTTGNVTISNASLNLKTNTSFYYDFALVPRLYRNVTSTSVRTSPLATLNMILGLDTGYIGNGGGPAIIFWNKDNVSAGETERNIGRLAAVWQNRTANTTSVDLYARSGVLDNNAVSRVLSAYTNGSNIAAGDTLANATIETGKIKLDGVGKGITMLSPDGNDWCVTVNNAGGIAVSAIPCS